MTRIVQPALTHSADLKNYFCQSDPGEINRDRSFSTLARRSVTDEDTEELRKLFAGASRVVEIGTGLGISTRTIASVVDEVVTVDIDPWVWSAVWPTLIADNIFAATDKHILRSSPFDAAFIDGNHERESVIEDGRFALRVGCTLVVFHDSNGEEIQAGIRLVFGEYETINTYCGLGVVRLP
jgi:hypothetical protein